MKTMKSGQLASRGGSMMSVTQVTESSADVGGKQEKQSRKWHLGHLMDSQELSV